jgi:hypothetical protein
VENRKWAPPIDLIDQRIALHAALSWDDGAIYGPDRDQRPIGYLLSLGFDPPARRQLYPSGALVATAIIDRVVTDKRTLTLEQERWFFGPYGWLLRDVQLLANPVTATGRLGLWTLPPELEQAVMQ